MTGPAPTPERPPPDGFRPDLEGLRGLAIILVVLFHAGIPGIPGGFVGVDVFFVLSGFLITGLLIREQERTGCVSLPAFYARRARRILPASLVVVVGTLLVAKVVLSPLDVLRAADDAVAVALSVGNIRFAAGATDYFAAAGAPSPFLHYWSLGVEEQFYLLWPALLIVATRFGRPRLGAGLVMGALVAASFALELWLTGVAAPWAFYSLPSRAWQLGLGGLVALTLDRTVRGRAAAALAAAGWTGLATVLAGAVLIDAGTPYPGVAALLPAIGTAAVIAAGGTLRWSAGRLLALPPLRFLGRISFSLYLVHWPILVLPLAGLSVGEELPLEARVSLALMTVPVAWVCWRLVEEPIHRATRFRAQPWRSLGLAGAAVAATLAAVILVGVQTSRSLDTALTAVPVTNAATNATPQPTTVAIAASPEPTPAPTDSPSPPTPIAQTPSPTATAAPSATTSPTPAATAFATSAATPTPTPEPTPSAPATAPPVITPGPRGPAPDPGAAQPLPLDVQPPLRSAAADRERIAGEGCELGNLAVQPRSCVYGNPNGAITVALVGDSHAAQWFPALEVLALRHDWRLVVFTKISCRFVDLPIYSRELKREYTECQQWREIVVTQLQELQPDLVVVSAARGMGTVNRADDNAIRQGEAMARLLARVPGRHAIIVDTPQSHVIVPDCLSGHIEDTRPCDTGRTAAMSPRYLLLERAAAEADGAMLINMTDVLCPGSVCPAVLNGYIVFRDQFHLTATLSASLAAELEAPLLRALGN